MNTLFRAALFGFVFCAFWWLIIFMENPYRFCKDHPDADLKNHYWLCEPFGFDFPRGKIENERKAPVLPFLSGRGQYVVPRDSDSYRQERRNSMCSDPAFRRTEHGREVCGE